MTKMSPAEVRRAALAVEVLEKALKVVEALEEQSVLGLELRYQHSMGNVERRRGPLEDAGWPDDLEAAMTLALKAWAEKRVADAKTDALAAGVIWTDTYTEEEGS